MSDKVGSRSAVTVIVPATQTGWTLKELEWTNALETILNLEYFFPQYYPVHRNGNQNSSVLNLTYIRK